MIHDQVAGYQHAASSYGYLGDDLPKILDTLTAHPEVLWEYIGRPDRLRALFYFLWPTAFLFLLAPEIAFFIIPNLTLLLASTTDTMGRLGAWYSSVLIVIIYWAAAMGINRLSGKWQKELRISYNSLKAHRKDMCWARPT